MWNNIKRAEVGSGYYGGQFEDVDRPRGHPTLREQSAERRRNRFTYHIPDAQNPEDQMIWRSQKPVSNIRIPEMGTGSDQKRLSSSGPTNYNTHAVPRDDFPGSTSNSDGDESGDYNDWSDGDSFVDRPPRHNGASRYERVDGVCNANSPRDFTVHMELDLYDDLEPKLEEFARLTRLGHFKAADQYYGMILKDQQSNPYVAAQYLYMLYIKGDYDAASRLKAPDTMPKGTPIDLNWRMIKICVAKSNLHSRFDAPQSVDMHSLRSPPVPTKTSTEIITLALLPFAAGFSPYPGTRKRQYDFLVREGRIWDCQVYMLDSLPTNPGEDYGSRVDTMWKDWYTETYDESTYLALLQTNVDFILWAGLPQSDLKQAIATKSLALDRAQKLAEAVSKHNPANMRSRPYACWIIAKAFLACLRSPSYITYNPSYKHVHIPWCLTGVNNPGRQRIEVQPWVGDSIRTALRLATQIGDYGTEALCRKLLVNISIEGREELEALARFQLQTQGDVHGYFGSCVSKYLFADTEERKETLRMELLALDGYKLQTANIQYRVAREVILKALTPPQLRWNGRRCHLVPHVLDIPGYLHRDVDLGLFTDRHSPPEAPPPPGLRESGYENIRNNVHHASNLDWDGDRGRRARQRREPIFHQKQTEEVFHKKKEEAEVAQPLALVKHGYQGPQILPAKQNARMKTETRKEADELWKKMDLSLRTRPYYRKANVHDEEEEDTNSKNSSHREEEDERRLSPDQAGKWSNSGMQEERKTPWENGSDKGDDSEANSDGDDGKKSWPPFVDKGKAVDNRNFWD